MQAQKRKLPNRTFLSVYTLVSSFVVAELFETVRNKINFSSMPLFYSNVCTCFSWISHNVRLKLLQANISIQLSLHLASLRTVSLILIHLSLCNLNIPPPNTIQYNTIQYNTNTILFNVESMRSGCPVSRARDSCLKCSTKKD